MSGPKEARLKENEALSANSRSRSKLSREIALALLVKLVLIVTIKFAFFNDPASKTEVKRRLDVVFGTQQMAPGPQTSSDSQRKEHD